LRGFRGEPSAVKYRMLGSEEGPGRRPCWKAGHRVPALSYLASAQLTQKVSSTQSEKRAVLRGLLRLGGAALGAILAAELVGRQAGPVLLGTAVGFGITEYAIRAEQTHPQEPTRQIRSKGLRRPVRHGLLPGMSQDEGGQKQRAQFSVEKERLARGRPVGTRAASRWAGSGHK